MTQTDAPALAKYRRDYKALALTIGQTTLAFDIRENLTVVKSKLSFVLNTGVDAAVASTTDLVLDGDRTVITLRSVFMNGEPLVEGTDYVLTDAEMKIPASVFADPVSKATGTKVAFELEIEVETVPETNTHLAGLYKSGSVYSTQCEANDFRRITYYLDRCDVMSRFTHVRIEADKAKNPILLSNGNKIDAGQAAENGRHFAVYEDPFPKPSYLFALVAGDLGSIKDSFVTQSGRRVALEVFSEHENVGSLAHAMQSLKNSMAWDEKTFGLEYDLDVYNIVAVNSFNMGAMENKSLNIFNTQYVLVDQDSATDDDYMGVMRVIGHEYFHNWTGNRVTCRDWFQLTLKEGLTVFRDQSFSGDMYSPVVRRIQDCKNIRSAQFLEDAGGMAHPIRPESYVVMDNFYTSTVYYKGAEVVRMYETLLSKAGFRKGMDLYFARHDGCAVTCDDFRAAMADANKADLAQFEQWYLQAGTPTVTVESAVYDAAQRSFSITMRQKTPPTPGQSDKPPLLIPVAIGLVARDSRTEVRATTICRLDEERKTFTFENVASAPVASVFRNFSAPVKVELGPLAADLSFLAMHDTDVFNRWDAGQFIYSEAITTVMEQMKKGTYKAQGDMNKNSYLDVFESFLDSTNMDLLVQAYTLGLPSEAEVASTLSSVSPLHLNKALATVRKNIATAFHEKLLAKYNTLTESMVGLPFATEKDDIGRRALRNVCLRYLSCAWTSEDAALKAATMCEHHYDNASCMTDKIAALTALVTMDCDAAKRPLNKSLGKFKKAATKDLVVNKWFQIQAMATSADALESIQALAAHGEFTLKNPNRARALVGFFARNTVAFHREDGAGYAFLASIVKEVDAFNPQLSARMVGPLTSWRRYEGPFGELMHKELIALQQVQGGCSPDLGEILGKALAA